MRATHGVRRPERRGAARGRARMGRELLAAVRADRGHELVQTAGLIRRVVPAREIVDTMVREAAERLAAVSRAIARVGSAA